MIQPNPRVAARRWCALVAIAVVVSGFSTLEGSAATAAAPASVVARTVVAEGPGSLVSVPVVVKTTPVVKPVAMYIATPVRNIRLAPDHRAFKAGQLSWGDKVKVLGRVPGTKPYKHETGVWLKIVPLKGAESGLVHYIWSQSVTTRNVRELQARASRSQARRQLAKSKVAHRSSTAPPAKKAHRKAAPKRTHYSGSPQKVARQMAANRGWGSGQFSCLKALWNRESGWNYRAKNPSSGAYGIPQALPGSKMRSAGADWRSNPVTQIRWGLGYIAGRYGTPCGAWSHSESAGWY